MSVSESVCSQGRGPIWPLPMIHGTSLHRHPPSRPSLGPAPRPKTSLDRNHSWTWDLTGQDPREWNLTEQGPLLVTSGGYWSTYGWRKMVVRILLEYGYGGFELSLTLIVIASKFFFSPIIICTLLWNTVWLIIRNLWMTSVHGMFSIFKLVSKGQKQNIFLK